MGKHRLHCSSCNWEFEAIVIFARLPSKSQRRRLKEEEKLTRWKQKNLQTDVAPEIADLMRNRSHLKEEEMLKSRFDYGEEYEDALLNEPDFDENFDAYDDLLQNDSVQKPTPVRVKQRIRLRLNR